MKSYWWVNHNKTTKEEVGNGYLWSPKTESNGRRNEFYNNMKKVKPGDKVISYANTKIAYIGTVADYASHSPKPAEFNDLSDYWDSEGWIVPVKWQGLETPLEKADFFPLIESLLPVKYSPLNPDTGNGNQKAYLSEVSQNLYHQIASIADIAGKNVHAAKSIKKSNNKIERLIIKKITNDRTLKATEINRLIKARQGQGFFRKELLRTSPACVITGVKNPKLLIASHIKPWRDSNNAERLDPNNGFLLLPHLDFLFDRGLISISSAGKILISGLLSDFEKQSLSIENLVNKKVEITTEQSSYLSFHENNIFLN